MTRVGDSSALYALFDELDPHHEAAREAVADLEEIVIPTEILAETIDLLAYRTNKTTARRALEALLRLGHVAIAGPIPIDGVLQTYRRSGGKISLCDSFVVQHCRVLGATPLTFDRAIRTAAK